jgi:hypothetical protein
LREESVSLSTLKKKLQKNNQPFPQSNMIET